jgi:hypothetical protein
MYGQDVSTSDVMAAPEWTALFCRTNGWFGGDGIFSIPLDGVEFPDAADRKGQETLLVFSDTYVGEVEDGRPLPGHVMVNNSAAILRDGVPLEDHIDFHVRTDSDGRPVALFQPRPDGPQEHFWLGDGFVNRERNNRLYLFAYHIRVTGPGVFDFIEPDVSILRIPKGERPPFHRYRQLKTPFHLDLPEWGQTNLGAGLLVHTDWAGAPHADGFVYVYGCAGPGKHLVVARVRPRFFERYRKWRFWNGKEWGRNPLEMAPVAAGVSNELSVTPLPDGKFALVFQVFGLSDKVGLCIGDSPAGPFSPIREIWTTPESGEGLLCYNAKAHPALSNPGELLISYNTITLDFWNDIRERAHIYRPRFIRLVWPAP